MRLNLNLILILILNAIFLLRLLLDKCFLPSFLYLKLRFLFFTIHSRAGSNSLLHVEEHKVLVVSAFGGRYLGFYGFGRHDFPGFLEAIAFIYINGHFRL